MTKLSSEEIERYARHIVLRGIGGPGQQKLKAAKVLVIGAGGLGSPLIQYLTASGVGEIGVVDDDTVSLSNLQRQVLFGADDVGKPKAHIARSAMQALNPHVQITPIEQRIDEGNARRIIASYDLVADGSDNFATRYAVSDACYHEGKTLVTAAVSVFDASITTLKPHRTGADGSPNPTYRCLFPDAPPAGSIPTCATAGILGALTGLVGSMMAIEVVREIVGGFSGSDEGLVGKLLLIDTTAMRFETIRYGWDETNSLNGSAAAASPRQATA
ncbi:MAG: molybdopterin-synthase adenylyltransferase MoeB [Beijerinckiaceae bacterium]|nr:molybdopterin-synthase adenylyltransferase MoeB [Beijerinckiaceae bacterium]